MDGIERSDKAIKKDIIEMWSWAKLKSASDRLSA